MLRIRSTGSGESHVVRPLAREKFLSVCDPSFEAQWYCNKFAVPPPSLRMTHGTRLFSGSYKMRTETITYTKPFLGVILHETAHHICHKLGLDGRGHHDSNFGKILQEMIDDIL